MPGGDGTPSRCEVAAFFKDAIGARVGWNGEAIWALGDASNPIGILIKGGGGGGGYPTQIARFRRQNKPRENKPRGVYPSSCRLLLYKPCSGAWNN